MKISARIIGLTFLGGAVGTWLRWLIAESLTATLVMLFVVNLVGTAALAVFNTSRFFDTDSRRAFFGVGLAGGFTTMSGVALWLQAASGDWLDLAIVFVMLLAGVMTYRLAAKWVR